MCSPCLCLKLRTNVLFIMLISCVCFLASPKHLCITCSTCSILHVVPDVQTVSGGLLECASRKHISQHNRHCSVMSKAAEIKQSSLFSFFCFLVITLCISAEVGLPW